MKKMIFDETVPLDGKRILEMLIKDGEKSLLGMPAYEVSKKVGDAVAEYVKEIGKPYIDPVETFLDEGNLINNNDNMNNRFNDDGSMTGLGVENYGTTYNTSNYKGPNEITKIPQNGYRKGLKDLLGNKLSREQFLNLQIVLEGVDDEVRRTYAGSIGYILSQDMSAKDGVDRFNQILKEGRIDIIAGAPDGPNINDSYWIYGEKILERLNSILEEK